MPTALEQYQQWKQQKNRIVSQLLKELSASVSAAAEMEDAFSPDEVKGFIDFHDRLMELQQKYPVVDGPPIAASPTFYQEPIRAKRAIQRNYTDETPRCSIILANGEQCSFPSAPGTTVCKKHTK